MILRNQSIPNLISGISQQPPVLRAATSLEVGDNVLCSPLDGLGRRPSAEFVKMVADQTTIGDKELLYTAKWHLINRDTNQQYWAALCNGLVFVVGLDGTVYTTVGLPGVFDYLKCNDPRADLIAYTNADYTFIVNKTKVVQKSTEKSPAKLNELVIWIRQAAPTTKYTLTINGLKHSVVTDNLDGPSAENVTTDWIADQFYEFYRGGLSSWGMFLNGSFIRMTAPAGTSIQVLTSDGGGDNLMVAINGQVEKFSDLPAKARNGMVVEVSGDDTRKFEKYWVGYETPVGSVDGFWKETVAPDTGLGVDPDTMPHALVLSGAPFEGFFVFGTINTWGKRVCGDEETNPWPSFVGRTISDVFFYKNRMGLLAGENVVLSKAGVFYDYFRDSSIEQVDTDPIDYAMGEGEVSDPFHAVVQNEDLLIFSEKTQYVLKGGDLLTPKSVSITATTNFDMTSRVFPITARNNIYFAALSGSHASVSEYFREGDTMTNDAVEVTEAVQALIPRDISRLVSSEANRMLIALAPSTPNILYAYTYYWRGQEKIQSAWGRWVYPEGSTVLAADWIEGTLHLVVKQPNGDVSMERMTLRPATFQPDIGLYLDRRIELAPLAQAYNQATDTTTWTLPYVESRPMVAGVWGANLGNWRAGTKVPLTTSSDGRSVSASGDLRGITLQAGLIAPQVWEPSRLYFRDQNGNAVDPDRTQLNRMHISAQRTGYFRVEVTNGSGRTSTTPFTGRRATNPTYKVGQLPVQDGELAVPLKGRNTDIRIRVINDSFFPAYFLSARWDGYAINKGGR